MTMPNQGHATALQAFAMSAISNAREKFNNIQESALTRIQLGNRSYVFAESKEFLTASVQHCCALQVTQTNSLPTDFKIYTDYSGWHTQFAKQSNLIGNLSHRQIEMALSNIGLHAIFNPDTYSWDILDIKNRFGVRLQTSTADTPVWEKTSPLAFFNKWIASADDKCMIHAGSLAHGHTGALIVGQGGAGKSGLVIGALKNSLHSAGDDYVALSNKSPYQAHAIYRTVKQDISGLNRLGLPTNLPLNWQKKAVFRPEQLFEQRINDCVPINVILMPRLGGVSTSFRRIDPTIIFKILTFSTLNQVCGDYKEIFQTCGELTRQLPCYEMVQSSDNNEITAKLIEFLSQFK